MFWSCILIASFCHCFLSRKQINKKVGCLFVIFNFYFILTKERLVFLIVRSDKYNSVFKIVFYQMLVFPSRVTPQILMPHYIELQGKVGACYRCNQQGHHAAECPNVQFQNKRDFQHKIFSSCFFINSVILFDFFMGFPFFFNNEQIFISVLGSNIIPTVPSRGSSPAPQWCQRR